MVLVAPCVYPAKAAAAELYTAREHSEQGVYLPTELGLQTWLKYTGFIPFPPPCWFQQSPYYTKDACNGFLNTVLFLIQDGAKSR